MSSEYDGVSCLCFFLPAVTPLADANGDPSLWGRNALRYFAGSLEKTQVLMCLITCFRVFFRRALVMIMCGLDIFFVFNAFPLLWGASRWNRHVSHVYKTLRVLLHGSCQRGAPFETPGLNVPGKGGYEVQLRRRENGKTTQGYRGVDRGV